MKSRTLKSTLLILALSMNVSPSLTARADDCAPLVRACDRALADQDRVIDLKGRAIEAQDTVIKAQDSRIVALEKDKPGFFQKPEVWLVVGMVVGGYLVGRAK